MKKVQFGRLLVRLVVCVGLQVPGAASAVEESSQRLEDSLKMMPSGDSIAFGYPGSNGGYPVPWGNWPCWGDQGDGTYRNPVLPSDYSDIDCIRVGSDYYAISSTFQYSPGVVILHSRDMVNWRILGHVIDDLTQIGPELNWDRMNRYGRGVWAGAIRYHDGRFRVYFGTPDEGYFMSTAENPAGPWDPLHCLLKEAGWDDCCPFWDDDGQGYFFGTHFADNYKTYLWKMDADGRTLVEESRTLINEGFGREANKFYKINGIYYHFFSEYKSHIGRYVMMQRAANITGPYTEIRQLSHAQRNMREPNQGGLVQTEKGDWYFLTHHGTGDWEGRCVSLLPVTWVDGWPILGQVGDDGLGTMVWAASKPVADAPITGPQTDDTFDGPKPGVQWEWNYQPRPDKWSLTDRPGFLRLYAFKPLRRDDLKKAGNTLTQRCLRTPSNVVTVALDPAGMADGQVAGLCLYSRDYGTIAVRRQAGILTLESAGKEIVSGPTVSAGMIWLRSTWGFDGRSQFAYSTNGVDFVPFGNPYQLGWGDYRGSRIGLFTYNNDAEAGYVDFDSFTYDYDSPQNRSDVSQQTNTSHSQTHVNGIMLGSWNSRVEFDHVKVVCGSDVAFSDHFDTELSGWRRDSGQWQVSDGVCRQISNATPAVTTYPLRTQAADYTVSVRAKKTGGTEGFLAGFGVQDSQNYYWLNLGGWNNTRHRLEKSMDGVRYPIGPAVNGGIETGRWYEIAIQVEGRRIRCFLDGRQIIDHTDIGFDMGELPEDNDKLNFGHALIPDLVADPSIVEFDGTFYCTATTDGWGQGLATSGTPVVWTSKDFLNWSFEGSSFPPDFDMKYWAPSSTIYRNGRYYSFPTLDGKVAVVAADSPTGPFVAPDGQHVTGATFKPYPIEQRHSIDAEVFIDDDGQAYMFWAMHRAVKLKPDLLEPDGPVTTIRVKREGYSEGPFLIKRNGIYYYLYTLGGDELYSYAYMMSRTSPLGPWESPEQDIIAVTDYEERVFGPGHGCFFSPSDSEQWYFIYLEYGRGGTNRQIYADTMNFNADGTIQPVTLTKAGAGALRPVADSSANLALNSRATASSVRRYYRVAPRKNPLLDRVETYAPANAVDGYNGTRWLAAPGDNAPWYQVDLGAPLQIRRTEAYFVKPAAGHAYRLEWSLDGQTWQLYGGHDDVIRRSPHGDEKPVQARYLKLTILEGEPGLWELRVY